MALQPLAHVPSSRPPRATPPPGHAVRRADTLADLVHIFAPEAQVCVHSRTAAPDLSSALEGLASSGWVGLRAVARLSATGAPDIAALPLPSPLAHPAFRRELTFLLELYGDLLGCEQIGLRIERLDGAMCPNWHVDRTGIRLLCTWSGPGTQWLDDPHIDRRRLPGSATGMSATGRAKPFDILLLKGSAWQGNAKAGAIHRSPPLLADSVPRVLVALDALWDT